MMMLVIICDLTNVIVACLALQVIMMNDHGNDDTLPHVPRPCRQRVGGYLYRYIYIYIYIIHVWRAPAP